MTATDDELVSYALVETGLGWIGIAWNARGLTRVQLPARDREATERRLLSTLCVRPAESADLPAPIADLVGMLKRYCAGETVDFSGVPIDLDGVEEAPVDPAQDRVRLVPRREGLQLLFELLLGDTIRFALCF